jgi:hypothetical protein
MRQKLTPPLVHEQPSHPAPDVVQQPQPETSITMEDSTDNDSDFSENEKNVPTLAKTKLKADDEVIIVTVKLPIQLYKEDGQWKKAECKSIIISTLFNLQRNNGQLSRTIWMGHPGVYPKSDVERQEIERILKEDNCIPIFID